MRKGGTKLFAQFMAPLVQHPAFHIFMTLSAPNMKEMSCVSEQKVCKGEELPLLVFPVLPIQMSMSHPK